MGWRVPEDSGAPTYLLSGLVQHGNGNVWAMGVVMGVGCCFGLDGAVECCCGCWEEWSSLLFLDLPKDPFSLPFWSTLYFATPQQSRPTARHQQHSTAKCVSKDCRNSHVTCTTGEARRQQVIESEGLDGRVMGGCRQAVVA